jgi:hypothetical protein
MIKSLDEITVNDLVLETGARRVNVIHKVTRLTKTQIVCGMIKFNKSTGYRVGTDIWCMSSVQYADSVMIQNHRNKMRKIKLVAHLHNIKWDKFGLKSIIKITEEIGKHEIPSKKNSKS